MVTRRTTFRIYPSATQERRLRWLRWMHQRLYNALLAQRKELYQKYSLSLDYYDQQNALVLLKQEYLEYKEIASMALQATVKRLDFAFQRFYKGLGGYPKFKSIRHYSGWTYPAKSGWKIESNGHHGYLELKEVPGRLQLRGKARTWGMPTTCTVFYRHGRWYASITVECNPVRETSTGAIGIDLGCRDAVTFSTGRTVAAPKFYSRTLEKVRKLSKQKRRKRAPNQKKKIRGSKRWRKASAQVSKVQRQAARQRQDWAHQLTAHIVSGHSLVVGEKLRVKNMTRKAKGKRKCSKAGLNRSILDTGMGLIGQLLSYKETEAGGMYLESPTAQLKPTQRCHSCWQLTPKSLSDRIHHCQHCSTVCGRDENAAKVNLRWGLGTGPTDDTSAGTCGRQVDRPLHGNSVPVRGTTKFERRVLLNRRSQATTSIPRHSGGWKQAWETKRQKLPVA